MRGLILGALVAVALAATVTQARPARDEENPAGVGPAGRDQVNPASLASPARVKRMTPGGSGSSSSGWSGSSRGGSRGRCKGRRGSRPRPGFRPRPGSRSCRPSPSRGSHHHSGSQDADGDRDDEGSAEEDERPAAGAGAGRYPFHGSIGRPEAHREDAEYPKRPAPGPFSGGPRRPPGLSRPPAIAGAEEDGGGGSGQAVDVPDNPRKPGGNLLPQRPRGPPSGHHNIDEDERKEDEDEDRRETGGRGRGGRPRLTRDQKDRILDRSREKYHGAVSKEDPRERGKRLDGYLKPVLGGEGAGGSVGADGGLVPTEKVTISKPGRDLPAEVAYRWDMRADGSPDQPLGAKLEAASAYHYSKAGAPGTGKESKAAGVRLVTGIGGGDEANYLVDWKSAGNRGERQVAVIGDVHYGKETLLEGKEAPAGKFYPTYQDMTRALDHTPGDMLPKARKAVLKKRADLMLRELERSPGEDGQRWDAAEVVIDGVKYEVFPTKEHRAAARDLLLTTQLAESAPPDPEL